MTVATSLNKIQYSGTGVRTTFPYNFKIFEDEDLVVILTAVDGTDTTWTLNTHYTVTGAGNIQGGNVVVKTSPVDYTPADGTKLTIVRIVDITQESDYVENAPFHAETLEDDFDKGTMIDQQLSEQWGRAITVAVTDVDADLELPNATTRANTFLTFGPSGEVDVSSLADIDLIDPGTAGRVVIYKTEHRLEQSAVSISNGVITASGGNSTQWNTAYGWGDHSTEGYITHDEVDTISGVLDGKITDAITTANDYTDTVSGVLSAEISAGDAATLSSAQDYTDTVSGALNTKLETHKTSDDHDGRYYTESEVTTISGDIVAQIPTDFYTQAEVTTISGDIVAQIPTDYYTQAEVESLVTTTSGDIITYVDDSISTLSGSIVLDHGNLTGLLDDDHTQYLLRADFTTSSGDIISYVDDLVATTSGDLVTYVDNSIDTLSGSIVLDHGGLTGLEDDDHTQYVLADGTRDITGPFRFTDNVIVDGDFTISGTTFHTAVEEVIINDNLLTINYGETTSGVARGTAGIEVDRGTAVNYYFYFVEADENFQIGISGSLQPVATRENIPIANAFAYWNASQYRFDTNSNYTTDTIVTESEFTTYSGDIISQIPDTSEFLTAAEITTISGDIVAQFPTDFYTQAEITTISGDIVAQIPTDFYTTNEVDNLLTTVSGDIISYVDNNIGTIMEGVTSIDDDSNTVTVSLPDSFDDTTYIINYSIRNLVDANPAQFGDIITTKSVNSFTVLLSAPTDSANYYVEWRCSDKDIAGGAVGEVNTASNLGAGTGVFAQKSTYDLQFKSFIGSGSVTIISGAETITISGSATGVGDSSLSSDHSYYANVADVDTVTVDDASSVFGNALYIAADFNYDRCDADAEATMPCRGIALEDGSGSKLILRRGKIRDDTWNWSVGDIYVSTSTGELTQSAPSGSGDVVQVVGHALSADIAYIDVMRDYVVRI